MTKYRWWLLGVAAFTTLTVIADQGYSEEEDYEDDFQPCSLYLAPSLVDGDGLGIFAGVDFDEGDMVGEAFMDTFIPIEDKHKALPYRGQQEFLAWLQYVWPKTIDEFYHSPDSFPKIPQGIYKKLDRGLSSANGLSFTVDNEKVSVFSPGIASLVNSHMKLANIKKREHTLTDVDALGDVSYANSPHFGVAFHATDDVPAGSEFLINYGATWHGRNALIQKSSTEYQPPSEINFEELPNEKEKRAGKGKETSIEKKRGTDEFLRLLEEYQNDSNAEISRCDSTSDSIDESSRKEQDGEEDSGMTALTKRELGTESSLRQSDDSEEDYNNDAEEEGDDDNEDDYGWEKYEAVMYDVEWLEENGICLDTLRWGRSTIQGAGRGAFVKEPFERGDVIIPSPVLTIKKSDLDIYAASQEEGRYRAQLDLKNQTGRELLMNYCYGHKDSPMLLVPYAPIVNFINHNGAAPNVEIRWPKGILWDLYGSDDWLEEHPLDVLSVAGELMIEFVALRDLEPGEELFIDYGKDWEEAWKGRSMDEPFRHEIGVPDGLFPEVWMHKSTIYEVAPVKPDPGQVVPLTFAHNGKPVSEVAFAVGLPKGYTQHMRGYTDQKGISDVFRKLLMAKKSVLGDNEWAVFPDNDGQEWFVHSYEHDAWDFNMHYIAAWDEDSRTSLLREMGEAGFDSLLESVGNHFSLDHLTCFHTSYMGATKCENSLKHADIYESEGKGFNIITAIELVNGSKAELDIISDDPNIVVSVNYHEDLAYVIGDYGYHKTSPHEYDPTHEDVRIVFGSYCAQIDKSNHYMMKYIYDGEINAPFMDQFELPLKEKHWSRDNKKHSLKNVGLEDLS